MSLHNQTRSILKKYQILPRRKRGQNFLINENLIKKIVSLAELKKSDQILEIGAGVGNLTKEIAKNVKQVFSVEIDKTFCQILAQELKDVKNVKIIQNDIRDFEVTEVGLKNYKIVSNIPFNITGLILKKFLTALIKPKSMLLIIQKEVAERIVSLPPQMSRLSIMVQFYAEAKIISLVSKNNFWPKPKIDSAILFLKIKKPILEKRREEEFFSLIRAGFSSPRKYLLNNLFKNDMIKDKEEGGKFFKKLNLDFKIRAQELSLEDWIGLIKLKNGK